MRDQLQRIEKIEFEFKEIIKRYFPQYFLRGWGSSGPAFRAEFAKENLYFEATDYFYKDNLTFFHLTDCKNLFSILNSRVFRMYNLHKSDDENEFKFSATNFLSSEEEIEFKKKRIYTFSFCPIKEIQNQKVWETYGNNYKGVAIIFQIINDPKEWKNFHMSEVKYYLSPTIEKYFEEVKTLNLKYPECTFDLELEKLMAFHKEEKWINEKEVRIVTYKPSQHYEDYLKFIKKELIIKEKRNRFAEYFDLNLWVNNDSLYLQNTYNDKIYDRKQILPSEDYFKKLPRIQIKDIVFGKNCGLDPEEYSSIKREIEYIIQNNFGYSINNGTYNFYPNLTEYELSNLLKISTNSNLFSEQ